MQDTSFIKITIARSSALSGHSAVLDLKALIKQVPPQVIGVFDKDTIQEAQGICLTCGAACYDRIWPIFMPYQQLV